MSAPPPPARETGDLAQLHHGMGSDAGTAATVAEAVEIYAPFGLHATGVFRMAG